MECPEGREKHNEGLRAQKGCFGVIEGRPRWVFQRDFKFYTCPSNFYEGWAFQAIKLYWKNRDQVYADCFEHTAKLVETYEIIDNLVEDKRREDQRKASSGKRSKR